MHTDQHNSEQIFYTDICISLKKKSKTKTESIKHSNFSKTISSAALIKDFLTEFCTALNKLERKTHFNGH